MAAGIDNHRSAGQPQFVPRKVLLVDEDVGDLQHYSAMLQQLGYEVRTYSTYTEGAGCLDSESFDLVVVSQGSRDFDWRSVVERAIAIDRRTPVLVVTRAVDMGCYLEAMQLGASDYLEKPVVPSEMARLVETHLRPRKALFKAGGSA